MQITIAAKTDRAEGFTLVELMVTIVIASILLAVAVPSYSSHVRKARRTEARTALLDLAGREERYLSANNAYSKVASDLGYSGFPQKVGSGYYQIDITKVTDPAAGTLAFFKATATPLAPQDKDAQCALFSIDSTGLQAANDSNTSDSTSSCWN